MSGAYQTFPATVLPPSVAGLNPSRSGSPAGSSRRSLPRLVFFGIVLTMIAAVLLGPLSFIVYSIKLYLYPDSVSPLDKSIASQAKIYLLTILPRLLSFPSYGPACSYYAYLYGGTMPGPTIRVFPGQSFQVQVVNTLGENPLTSTRKQNQLRFPNSTSTHFHGLHVSPEGEADNVFQEVGPGENFTHKITLREDHPPGTYWIHPHLHGSTSLQTSFSMASPLIVLDKEQPWLSLPEEIFMIQRGGVGSGHKSDDARLAFEVNEGFAQPQSSSCVEPNGFVLVNGAPGPFKTLCEKDYVRRWRIINAASDGGLVLNFEPSIDLCEAKVIARDGIYLREGKPRSVAIGKDVFVVPPGGRIDFLVKGQGCELKSQSAAKVVASLGPKTDILSSRIASCVVTKEEPQQEGSPARLTTFPLRLPALPYFMDDLRSYPKAERRVLEWTEFSETYKNGEAKYGINGEPFSKNSRFTVRLDRVQEWTIVNAQAADGGPAVESHTFHMHTNHFQIVGYASEVKMHDQSRLIGQWRDTVFVPTPGNLTIRWVPRHFTGKTLMHCHTLSHEDTGMSWAFTIVDRLR